MAKTRSGDAAVDKAWQAQMDCDTLCRAREIESDPKRLAAARAEAKRRLMEVAAVAGEAGKDD